MELDDFIFSRMPYFIAVNYKRLLEAQTPRQQIEIAVHVYNLSLRILTITQVSQYLTLDREKISDPYLNELLLGKFPHLTLDSWQELFFATLRSYEGFRHLCFVPELYDFYWDTSTIPHQKRDTIEQSFEQLTQLAKRLQTEPLPLQDEVGWGLLAEETKTKLQQILHSLNFMDRYDFIRVLSCDNQFYYYELHKGLSLSTGRRYLPRYFKLSSGHFYLRNETKEAYLLLHPFLIYCEGKTAGKEQIPATTGIYDHLVGESDLKYLSAELGTVVLDDRYIEAFLRLIDDTIREVKQALQDKENLTWWQLRQMCEDISKRQMATISGRYVSPLCFRRHSIHQVFEEFLRSDKRCFVLVGKTGVGKSYFLLTLSREIQSSSNLCILIYDGAHLAVIPSITKVISQHIEDRLSFHLRRVDKPRDKRIEDIWREIAQIDGIGERQIILVVDGVSESPEAQELIRQLDELVQSPWPWLKIVLTARMESWNSIKQRLSLAEGLYYRLEETNGVALEPFVYSKQLEPFSPEERGSAYANYEQVFNLQTSYEKLPIELQEMISDPPFLLALAKAYKGQPIPTSIASEEMVTMYLIHLEKSGQLHLEEDLRFLRRHLMPLMIKEDHYHDAIPIVAVVEIWKSLKHQPTSIDGIQIKRSYANLLDAAILEKCGEGPEQKICFKNSFYYEYFAGERIWELSKTQVDRIAFFRHLVEQTTSKPALKKAVKKALIEECSHQGTEIILTLSCLGLEQLNKMVADVLVEYGRNHQDEIKIILARLLYLPKKRPIFQRFRQFFRKSGLKADAHLLNPGQIATKVANALKISDIDAGLSH